MTAGVRNRRAEPADADFLVSLYTHEEVEPFLAAVRPKEREAVLEQIERSQREPDDFGVFLIEVEQGGTWHRAGVQEFERVNRRSRIAHLSGLAVHPDFRGRGVAGEAVRLFQRHLLVDLGLHRLQLEVYGFNERALRQAERHGFVREGVRRKAYWRDGDWVDGVLFGLVREDLEERAGPGPPVRLSGEVERRLREEELVWLTTAGPDGRPQPRLVWFLWDGRSVLVYSQPGRAKLRNIGRERRVSLNFSSDAEGGSVAVLAGEARIAEGEPPADRVREYVAKYARAIERLGWTPEEFAADYSVPIRVEILGLHGI